MKFFLSMGFSAMMMGSLLGGCGEVTPQGKTHEERCEWWRNADVDFDNDGLVGDADVCPFTKGDAAHKGCLATPKIGDACYLPYKIKTFDGTDIRGSYDNECPLPQYLEPSSIPLVCQPDPADGLLAVVRNWSALPRSGTWIIPTYPFPTFIESSKSGGVLTWTKRDGTTGKLDALFSGHPPWIDSVVVPSDNSLATIEGDPDNTLSVTWETGPNQREEIRPCTDKNASGGPLCRF